MPSYTPSNPQSDGWTAARAHNYASSSGLASLATGIASVTSGTYGTTASSAYSTASGMSSVALTTNGGNIRIDWSGYLGAAVASGDFVVAVRIDNGTEIPISSFNSTNTVGTHLCGFTLLTGIAAGAHVIDLRVKSTGAVSGSLGGDANRPSNLMASEVQKFS